MVNEEWNFLGTCILLVAREKLSKLEKMLQTQDFQKFPKNTFETQFYDMLGFFLLFILYSLVYTL
jgi:hypothetical protein